MKRVFGMFSVMLFIVISIWPVFISGQEVIQRGLFNAKIGLQDSELEKFELNGNLRNIRNQHLIFGTATIVDSERTFRFQGSVTRSYFIIQSASNARIMNIVGSFMRYNEETNSFYGQWRGYIAGYGFLRGWIEASIT